MKNHTHSKYKKCIFDSVQNLLRPHDITLHLDITIREILSLLPQLQAGHDRQMSLAVFSVPPPLTSSHIPSALLQCTVPHSPGSVTRSSNNHIGL